MQPYRECCMRLVAYKSLMKAEHPVEGQEREFACQFWIEAQSNKHGTGRVCRRKRVERSRFEDEWESTAKRR